MAQPLARSQYFLAHLLFGVGAVSAMLAAGLLGTAIGQQVYSLDAFGWRLGSLFLNMLLLQLAIYALTLFASAFGREAGRVALVGVLVAVVSFLVNAVAVLWSKAAFAKPYSLHGHFDPREILVQGQLSTSSMTVLAVVAAIATIGAFVRFARRDLP
jgi:ABC-type transport system involved in multi-copper enzyme maturation permease subunit